MRCTLGMVSQELTTQIGLQHQEIHRSMKELVKRRTPIPKQQQPLKILPNEPLDTGYKTVGVVWLKESAVICV